MTTGFQVVLVTYHDSPNTEFLGLGYLSAIAKKHGYSVELLHIVFGEEKAFIDTLVKMNPGVIGMPLMPRTHDQILQLCRMIDHSLPHSHITLGHIFPFFHAQELLQEEPAIDSVVRGEGEYTFLELLDRLSAGRSLDGCLGLTYREGDSIYANPDRPWIQNLDELPFPDRSAILHRNKKKRVARIAGSRGCTSGCGFCNVPAVSKATGGVGSRWRRRSPKNIVDEIEFLQRTHHIHVFDFVDESFHENNSLNYQWLQEIANEILSRKLDISFSLFFRDDHFEPYDDQVLSLLKRAGLIYVYFGMETVHPYIHEKFKKRGTVQNYLNTLNMLASNQIISYLGYIFYHPYNSFSEMRLSAKFLHDSGHGWQLRHYQGRLVLLPGSPIISILERDGLLKENYSFRDIYGYRFQEERVSHLADSFSLFSNRGVYEIERVINRLDMYRAICRRKLAGIEGSRPRLEEFEANLQIVKDEINEANYSFVSDSLDLAEAGWEARQFSKLQEAYNASVDHPLVISHLNSLHAEFRDAVRQYGIDLSQTAGIE
jgi:anaerobic magnesium-protoporphyrin IX monomethyl ester cyclase